MHLLKAVLLFDSEKKIKDRCSMPLPKVILVLIWIVVITWSAYGDDGDEKKQKVILLLLDGLRWDSYDLDLPHLKEVERNGVKANWMNGVFISMSTPSMYSIATGLYPESHGAIHNLYFDPVTKNRTYSYPEALNITEWFDTGAEPIWVTAIMQGLHAGTILYPGGNVPIKGIRPDKNIPSTEWFWLNYEMKSRVDDAISWLTNDDMDLVMLYFDNPDEWLHKYGIGSQEAIDKLYEVDNATGYLFRVLEERGLDETVNVIIASDHGHINSEDSKHVNLYDYISESDIDFIIADYGPTFQLVPVEGKLDEVYETLKAAHPALHVYKKEVIPERFHYGNHERVLPIFGFVDPGWHLHTRVGAVDSFTISDHGYDTQWMVMKSSFYAQGPYFRKNYVAAPLESVDLYQLMCEILSLDPAPNNGSRARYVDMLASSEPALPTTAPCGNAPPHHVISKYASFLVLLIMVFITF